LGDTKNQMQSNNDVSAATQCKGDEKMKKLMVMAAMLALMLAAAVPAFAASAVGGSVEFVDCDQAQAAATVQVNAANNQRLAGVAQDLSVEQNQVLACSDSIAAGMDVNIN
jgi:hypothetical protein